MKAFLRGLLTIWIFLLLIVFGISLNAKKVLINTTDGIIKEEMKKDIVDIIKEYDNAIPGEVIAKIETEIDNNKELQNIMNTYYDKILDVLTNGGAIQMDIAQDLEKLIDSGEEILKEYNITITAEQKKELLEIVSSDEMNNIINDAIDEIRDDMDDSVKTIIEVYTFATSFTFTMIVVGLIAVALLLIALLKKSCFKWLSNFGIASVLSGVLFGVLLPILVTNLLAMITEDGIVINISSLTIYGYVLMGLGILCIVLNIILSKKKVSQN